MRRRFKILKFQILLTSLLLVGCVPKPPTRISQPVTVTVEAPPRPPSPEELEKPPSIPLDKANRDPFIVLGGEGGATPLATGKGSTAAGGNFVVSGIMLGQPRSSAILESGSMSYIVHQGDLVAGYRVSSIMSHSVVLVRGKEKLVLTFIRI